MNYYDRGHYYLNGELIDGMTLAKCRDAGGIVSVTTKLDSATSADLVFWKIGENIEAAYAVLDKAVKANASLEDFRKLVADEFYRTHNYLYLGDIIHKFLDNCIKNGIRRKEFREYFLAHAHEDIQPLQESITMGYDWFLENAVQGKSEVIAYNKDLMVAGTCDFNGVLRFNGQELPGGFDWKSKTIRKHPGYKKDGGMKAVNIKRQQSHKMQLGAYGKVFGWKCAFILNISTNPDIPYFKAHPYAEPELIEGYKSFAHLGRSFDIQNKFIAV